MVEEPVMPSPPSAGNIAEVRRPRLCKGKRFNFGDNFINDQITDYGSSRRRPASIVSIDRQHLQGEHV
jgi:hypothetical protein